LTETIDQLRSWSSEWSGHHLAVLGLGATGFAIVDTFVELGCDVLALANEADSDTLRILDVLGVTPVVGEDAALSRALADFSPEALVISPGVVAENPVVMTAQALGVPLWSDLDTAWRVRDKQDFSSPWVIVAGETYGLRLAELAARLLNAGDVPALVVGHQCEPVLNAVRDPHDYQALVVVASENQAMQLARGGQHRSPHVVVCVEENSILRDGALFDGTQRACVYRKGVGPSMSLVEDAEVREGARAIGVGFDSPGPSDLGLVEGIVVDRAFLDDRANHALEVSTVEELSEAGWTIPEDLPVIVGAIAIARAFDVSPAVIAGVLTLP